MQHKETHFPQSPDDIMQRVHDNNLDAAAEALAGFSMGCGFGGAQQQWQSDLRAVPELPERPLQLPPAWGPGHMMMGGAGGGAGHMMHPRAQSWPAYR